VVSKPGLTPSATSNKPESPSVAASVEEETAAGMSAPGTEREASATASAWAGAPVFQIKSSLADESRTDRARLRRVVTRAKAGERDALRELYERYADNVFSYVRTIIHDEHEAEDVTQHVFTKLLTKIDRYEERSVPFAAWLLRIARNCAIDHVRGNRAICYEELPVVAGSASEDVAAERRHAIEDALRALPEGQRRVVVLRHVVGLSPREIASQMGKSEGAVHTLHHRARRAMRTELLRRDTSPIARPQPVSATA
jgi:RNA polymerase sigma-70 factor (ECF subfamily)